ncbi:protein kinase [Micromonospora sp. NPDC005194]|uniref:protein kinase domain-containing protein n=1 Tax=Micromonospora sp. NPDC005194 TaxID=3156870 RepID=UPI0033A3D0C1
MPDRYRVGEHIDSGFHVKQILHGGMGTVYVCARQDGYMIVIKSLDKNAQWRSGARERFDDEAAHLCLLPPHPCVVQILGYTPRASPPELALEFVPGGDLRDFLRVDRADQARKLTILTQVASGLAFLHDNNVIHGDLKPENVLLDANLNAKLSDFGLARSVGPSQQSSPVALGGTLPYMAPETVAGTMPDERSDSFALGVLSFELLAGLRPSEVANTRSEDLASAVRPHVGPEIAAALASLLAASPDLRESAARVASLLAVHVRTHYEAKKPTFGELSARAASLSRMGRHEESLELHEKALKISGGNGIVYDEGGAISDVLRINYSTALRRAGRFEEAERYAIEALENCPNDLRAHSVLIGLYSETGRLDLLDHYLDRAHEIDPKDRGVQIMQMQRAAHLGDKVRVERLARGLRKSATSAKEVNGLAASLVKELNAPELGLEIFIAATRKYPEDARIWANLGITQEIMGNPAHESYIRAVEVAPHDSYVRFLLARSKLLLGDNAGALTDAKVCEMLSPETAYSKMIVGLARFAFAPDAIKRSAGFDKMVELIRSPSHLEFHW